jgi:hypothetical protein
MTTFSEAKKVWGFSMRFVSNVLAGAIALSGLAGFSGSASALVVDFQADASPPLRAINSPPSGPPGNLLTATAISIAAGWSTADVTSLVISNPIHLSAGSLITISFDIGADAFSDTLTEKAPTVNGDIVDVSAFGELVGTGAGMNTSELDLSFTQAGGAGHSISGSATYSTSTVPEPSTWVMVGIGFMGLGYAASRRRAKGPVSVFGT